MIATLTLTGAPMQSGGPKYYAGNVGSGECGIAAGGLALEVLFADITASNINLNMDFSTGGTTNGICASVKFLIKDINADESVQTFADWVLISAIDGNGAAVPAANIVINLGTSVSTTTAGNTKTLKGYTGSYGSRSTSACNTTTVTITPPAGVPLNSITLNYHPDWTASPNWYYNFLGPPKKPARQYIVIGQLDATLTGGCIVTLPIELKSFVGKCNGTKKTLQWATISETNNKYFTIEHSKDGNEFEALAQVNGRGNSTQVINYEYSFDEESSHFKYYRLKQTDFNGKTTFLKSIYLNCVDKIGSIKLFPNPATDKVNLVFESSDETILDLNVTDIAGRVVKTIKYTTIQGTNEIALDTDDLPQGLYNIVIGDTNGIFRTQTLKFIKSGE